MPKISQKQIDLQKRWEDRISRAKKVRKNWKDIFRVDLARDYLDGKQNPGYPQNEWITINLMYSNLKAQLPALYSADPYFYVKLRRSYSANPLDIAMWEQRGKIRGAYLNYLKEELELKSKARLCIQDAFTSYGIVKVHYYAERQENPDFGAEMTGDDGETLYGPDNSPLMEPETIPINERYCITRIHPDDFVWDEDAGPLQENWHWVAQCVRESWGKIKANPMFNKRAVGMLEGKGETKGEEEDHREERKKGSEVKGRAGNSRWKEKTEPKEDEIIPRWEIYNIEQKTWLVVAEGGDIPLIDEEPMPPGIEKHPFAILRFTLRDDSPYPIPILSQGIDVQKEYNLSRSRLLTHRKRFNRKYEANIAAMGEDPEEELAKLESGDDGTVIKTNMTGAIKPIQDAQLDQMGIQEIMMLKQDVVELMGGAHDESRGIAGAESATQAGILDKRLEMKEGDSMSMVVDFVKDIARKLDMLVQTHITRDEAVRVTGPQGVFWELVRQTDYQEIQGEFEYAVNVGATLPRLPQMERASWQAFLTLLAQFPHLLLSKRLMKQMAEMHHIEDEAMLNELYQLGQMIMRGQMPMPGGGGSQAGVGEERPMSAIGGQAGGPLSLGMPGAGNMQ